MTKVGPLRFVSLSTLSHGNNHNQQGAYIPLMWCVVLCSLAALLYGHALFEKILQTSKQKRKRLYSLLNGVSQIYMKVNIFK